MFKKLKQKIEEGGEGGLEKVSFSQMKLPGSVVRSNSRNESRGAQLELPTQDAGVEKEEIEFPLMLDHPYQNGEVPSHLNLATNLGYQAMLESRVSELEQECSALKTEMKTKLSHQMSQQSKLETQISHLDQQRTELKVEVIELELDRTAKLQELGKECDELRNRLVEQEVKAHENQTNLEVQITQLKAGIEEKETHIIEEENKFIALEKKMRHLKSQLEAYENSSESEVVDRLHHEVADFEQRVKSRNLEIQILERRLASQAKESQDQVESLLSKQEDLMKSQKEAEQIAIEEKLSKKGVLKELENVQQKNIQLNAEREELKIQLASNIQIHQSQMQKSEQLKLQHEKQIQELDQLIEDKDMHIKELLHRMKQVQHEGCAVGPVPRPPGMPRRTVSIGVQTNCDRDGLIDTSSQSQTTLVSIEQQGDDRVALQQQHSKLEEELAEKMKIIKVQQQKIMDMKKELRLKMTSACPMQYDCDRDLNPNSSPSTCNPSPSTQVDMAVDVNFQYLKHVVIKFVCSREDEALQLIRALSTLLKFSPQEEEHVKSYLNYKMSWFGAIPPPLFPHNSSFS